ncbi:hypothetical protein NPIL_111461 [Nephila pilipes]|uniref:Uncharacterized protein n=1 Tax=Nephila pilipes TaxID=299642 RepID=A0A8X6TC35_NEPPI|nr:hypothetical protein NPIL_111461 [Nephila pilipes]
MEKVTCSYCEGKFDFNVVYMVHPCKSKDNSSSYKMSQVDEKVFQCSNVVKDCYNLISEADNQNESTNPYYRLPKTPLPYFPTPGIYSSNCCAKSDPVSFNTERKRRADDEISQVTKPEKRHFS